jgi:hypothetical protein
VNWSSALTNTVFINLLVYYFFCSTGVWTQDLHLKPLHQPLFCDGYFQNRALWTICLGWLWSMILQISAFWVARIIGMSHQCPAYYKSIKKQNDIILQALICISWDIFCLFFLAQILDPTSILLSQNLWSLHLGILVFIQFLGESDVAHVQIGTGRPWVKTASQILLRHELLLLKT